MFKAGLHTGPCPRHRLAVHARSPAGQQGQSRLIIPGRGGSAGRQDAQQSRLIIPGQERKSANIDTSGIPGPSTSTFRPPPGFMDTANPRTEVLTPLEPAQVQTALERLNASAGAWHELANLLPKLDAAGYDSTAVEMETGIDRATQNVWAVSQHVYDSLNKSGAVPPEKMAYFDDPEGAMMLYHIRFLPASARPQLAAYIVDQQLSVQETSVLARAAKEQERRQGDKEGFTSSPGDCLAYKYHRDAVESRSEDQRKQFVQKGIAVADSESARATLRSLGEEKPEAIGSPEQQGTVLETIRLTGDEVEFRPIPLVGELAETSASSVAAAVGVRQAGPYNAFAISPEVAGQQFVALPAFRSLLYARSPVAISLSNCMDVHLIRKSVKAVTDDDKRKHGGPGLLVIERDVQEHASPGSFYVCQRGSSCELVEGSAVTDEDATLGQLLFLCRPPARNAQAKFDSYALMSL